MVTSMAHLRLKAAFVVGALSLLSVPAFAGADQDKTASNQAPVSAPAVRDNGDAALSFRLFPVLSAIGGKPAVLDALRAAPHVSDVLAARQARRAACGKNLTCLGAGDDLERR